MLFAVEVRRYRYRLRQHDIHVRLAVRQAGCSCHRPPAAIFFPPCCRLFSFLRSCTWISDDLYQMYATMLKMLYMLTRCTIPPGQAMYVRACPHGCEKDTTTPCPRAYVMQPCQAIVRHTSQVTSRAIRPAIHAHYHFQRCTRRRPGRDAIIRFTPCPPATMGAFDYRLTAIISRPSLFPCAGRRPRASPPASMGAMRAWRCELSPPWRSKTYMTAIIGLLAASFRL